MTKYASVSALALFHTIAAASAETLFFTNPFEIKVQNDGLASILGSNVPGYFIDGGGTVAGDSAHAYEFIRFENLYGSDPGQIPAGATVLSASLTMWTPVRSNAQSPGPFGVAPLLAPFAATNVYSDYSGPGTGFDAGPSYINQHTGRPVGGFSGLVQDTSSTADVTLALQQWTANPSSAYGFAIQPRTTDGWFPETVGSSTPDHRPVLMVNYTTAPATTFRFQQGVNGYAGTTTALLDANGTTTNGASLGGAAFLDGPNAAGDSRDIQALLKFENLFGDFAGQIPADQEILRAYLVLTTGNTTESHSNGTFDVQQMLVNWDTTSTFGSFGGDGPTTDQYEVGAPLGTARGMTQNSQSQLDVTDAVRSWQSGADNFGLNVQSNTTDGWNIFFSGATTASVRPELVVITTTAVPEPGSAALLAISALGALSIFRRRRA